MLFISQIMGCLLAFLILILQEEEHLKEKKNGNILFMYLGERVKMNLKDKLKKDASSSRLRDFGMSLLQAVLPAGFGLEFMESERRRILSENVKSRFSSGTTLFHSDREKILDAGIVQFMNYILILFLF